MKEHESSCTYRQNLSDAAQESMGEKAYVSNDPTVGATSIETCTMCGECLKCSTCGKPEMEDTDPWDFEDLDRRSK